MLRVGFVIVWLLAALAARAERLPQMDGQPYFPPSRLKRLPYFEQTTVEAYRAKGSRNPQWDRNAEAALAIFARFLCFEQVVTGTTNLQLMVNALKAAREAGCDDPLVAEAALLLRQRGAAPEPQPTLKDYRPIVEGLKQHSYPPSRQGWIYARAAQAALRAPADKAQARRWSESGLGKLAEAVAQRDDREDLYELAPQLFSAYAGAADDIEPALELFKMQLAQRSALSNEVAMVICASGLLERASDLDQQRKTLPAGTDESVRKTVRSLAIERIEEAEKLLTAAWKLDPTDAFLCKQMMRVLEPQIDRPDEFHQWFDRGKQADPAYYGVCTAKLDFLLSRRHGREQALAFGRACVKEGNWLEQIPFILLDAHQKLAVPGYERGPEVWSDLQQVYETYLRLYPGNNVVRSSYAYCAYAAQRWDLARGLMQQLGDLAVPGLFRGHYQDCLAALKQHAGSSPSAK